MGGSQLLSALPASQSLVGALPEGPLDIVGDVHGEWQALQNLLRYLGYGADGRHPGGRTLVFVGDLCDRGPNTPAVLDWFCDRYEAGYCHAVLGNHEINLIRGDAKDGAGWCFDARTERDRAKYAPFVVASARQRERYNDVCAHLPVALERADLRVVHAAWLVPQIEQVRSLARGSARRHYDQFEEQAHAHAHGAALQRRVQLERTQWPHDLENEALVPPLLRAHGERELLKQICNPLKALTTGIEQAAMQPFFAGGKWRFVERMPWWNAYDEATPVVIGHYWRQFLKPLKSGNSLRPVDTRPSATGIDGLDDEEAKAEAALFSGVPGNGWHGKHANVFCVDFSVGARWRERLAGVHAPERSCFRLAALRWPEQSLQFDNGESWNTAGVDSLD